MRFTLKGRDMDRHSVNARLGFAEMMESGLKALGPMEVMLVPFVAPLL